MDKRIFTAACVQLNSGNNLAANIARARELIIEAAKQGADFIALPENAFFMGESREDSLNNSAPYEEHAAIAEIKQLAAYLKTWVLIGSIGIKVPEMEKLYNRSVLINPEGELVEFYDKIHLFDVTVKDDQKYLESENIFPGERSVLVDLPWGKLGFSICYDVRFPQLYRKLAKAGAEIIAVPAAFTYKTGEAHWHTLLRARAIENASFIIAPAQCGNHPRGRQTYGHSLIIDPWGRVLAEASEDKEEVILAKIDLNQVDETRQLLPSLMHDREIN